MSSFLFIICKHKQNFKPLKPIPLFIDKTTRISYYIFNKLLPDISRMNLLNNSIFIEIFKILCLN